MQYLGRSRRAECTLPGAPFNGTAGRGGGRLWLMAGERGQLELQVAAARKEDLFYVRTGFEAQAGPPLGSSLEVRLQQKHTGQAVRLLALPEVRVDDTRPCVLPLSLEPVHAAGAGVLHVLLDGKHVRGSPYVVHVRPGPILPAATLLLSEDGSADVAYTSTGVTGRLRLVLRDAWGNRCRAPEPAEGMGGGVAEPPMRIALVPIAGSGGGQRLSAACLEAARRTEDPEEGVEIGSDADGGVLLYYTRHHAGRFEVRLMLHGTRIELPMVVRVLTPTPTPTPTPTLTNPTV